MTRLLLTALLVLTFAAGCGGDDEDEGEAGEGAVTVELAELNSSGQTGTATLTPEGAQTLVVVEVSDPVSPSQPAHIHAGTCDNLDPAPLHGLLNVTDGHSETTVDASLDSLTDGEFAINLHMSDEDAGTYTSCGNIEG